jgi:hypothetical protein
MRTADVKDADITRPCSSSTLLSRYVSVICVPLWLPFILPFTLYHKAAIPSFGSMLRYSLVPPTIHSETGWLPLLYSLGTIRVLGLSMGHASHTVANPDSLVPYGP